MPDSEYNPKSKTAGSVGNAVLVTLTFRLTPIDVEAEELMSYVWTGKLLGSPETFIVVAFQSGRILTNKTFAELIGNCTLPAKSGLWETQEAGHVANPISSGAWVDPVIL